MSKQAYDQWLTLSPLLDKALEMGAEERTAWLGTLDPEVAGQIDALLLEHEALARQGFLENEIVELDVPPPSLAGQILGVYQLVSQIGQGGMGSVWLAERVDGRFERRAAVKFLNIAFMGKSGEERFKREGKILGLLNDPHIAELIDAGVTTAGQPYLVLEYVEGDQIDRYSDQHRLDTRARVRLFLDVLEAVAKAHASLVVHRDLKPSNILVSNESNQVKLLDFGIAKLIEGDQRPGLQTALTLAGGHAMTPEYAAPEQLKGEPITTATDIYALGVLLYLLLTGHHPAGIGPDRPADLVKAIVESEPIAPSDIVASTRVCKEMITVNASRRSTTPEKLRRALRGDLDTIVARAMKKEPAERYPSVTALADDLRHYLRNEPIGARRDSLVYRTRKFVRRNRTAVALATVAFVAIVAGGVGTLLQARSIQAECDLAQRQLARAERTADLNELILTDVAPMGKPLAVNQLLAHEERVVEREHNPDAINHVELLLSIGDQYSGQDDNTKALQVLTKAYQLSRGLKDRSIRAKASCVMAGAVVPTGDLVRAEALYHEGLHELPNSDDYALDRAYCDLRGSEVAYRAGNSREAIARARSAEKALKESPIEWNLQELNVLINLAGVLGDAGQFREADEVFQRASTLMTSLGYDGTQKAVKLYNDWALIQTYAGRQLQAERTYRRAIDISRTDDTVDSVSPVLLYNYAAVLRDLGRNAEAAGYAERAAARARVLGDQILVDQTTLLKARFYLDKQDFGQARALLTELEPRLRSKLPPQHYAFASLASDRSQLALEAGDLPGAIQYADQAVKLDEASLQNIGQCAALLPTLLVRRSNLELQARRQDLAAGDATRALELLQPELQSGIHSSNVGRAYLARARALKAQGKDEEAQLAFHTAYEHLQDTLGPDHPETRSAYQLATFTCTGVRSMRPRAAS
jgi:eukaryotic-like serine/threonine-protein kinase